MGETADKYVVSGYDGEYVTGSDEFDNVEEAEGAAINWTEDDGESDIVIVKKSPLDTGAIHETIVKVLKGSEVPFMKGINARNQKCKEEATS